MAFFQWRRFNFFELLKETDNGTLDRSFKDVTINCSSSGRGYLILGDNLGLVHLFDRQYQRESFKAYNVNTSHVLQLKQSSFLGTVGEDDPGINPVIKIWNLEKKDIHGCPVCVHLVRALPGNRPVPVTAFTIDEQMHLMAAGFADGSIVLYRGDLSRERHSKQKFLQAGTSLISGLCLRTTQKMSHLYVATLSTVVMYTIVSKDKEQFSQLDTVGCSPGCFAFADSKQGQHFMIARNDAVYCYTVEGRGPCYAFEGEKLDLHWFRGYLIIVSKIAGKGDADSDKTTVTIFDVNNKFIAFTAPIAKAYRVISEWGSLLVLTKDKNIHQLMEKDLHTKLDILFKKNLYDVAIRVAKSQQYDIEGLMEIFKLYGDHLYAKGNHSGAMEQYLKTIGRLEPSYVIKKFLDAQRIHQLTAYLQELHKQGLASEDHTTLLLNCYTKLRDTDRLNQFLNTKDQRSEFDVETAIRVCRQAGYFEQALRLAEDRGKHEWHLKILLEDLSDYRQALEYIQKLPPDLAKVNLQEYGNVLLEELPDETTKLLLDLCCSKSHNNEVCDPEEFLLLFINRNEKLVEFLENVLQVHPNSNSSLHFALLEQYLLMWTKNTANPELEKKITLLLQNSSVLGAADRALFLCQTHKFRPGILFIFEKTKLYGELLHFYANENNFESVISTCRRFGQQEPSLWVRSLTLSTSNDKVTTECLAEILASIEKLKLLPALRVIEMLGRSPNATLGLARDYLIRTLQSDQSNISEDERLIQQYRQETEAVREKIKDIKTSALVFQGSKCNVCNQPLELPSVHFLCLHSFHQHCFDSYADNENECPACHTENKRILDIVRAQEQSKDLHEAFHGQLEKADDPFTVLADYFGRGVFNSLPSWETAISGHQGVRTDLSSVSWGPQNAGPGFEAKLRKSEGKSCANLTAFVLPGFTNEGRVRLQENASVRPTRIDVTEGRLRNAEVIGAVERAASNNAATTTSEARHRLQEGTNAKNFLTTPVEIPRQTVVTQSAASVPNYVGAVKAVVASGSSDFSTSLRKSSNLSLRKAYGNQANAEPENPFKENTYDESKNPFADEQSSNPFGDDEDDYNDSLNPFAE
ncbi:vacuolar protein sorting-associated protein 11 homolog isoform X1 [Daphnia magna]|uniref:vacuolar protein sorting-associated protein 11 homolog isoform X1 n=1 Tax=Daphnia magna TaxID=35525 RepID=UPI001E1BD13F|nr:vacuolar protein sorting-associated protein 11 homolog isoform X1 [Daphnia magna]